MKKSLIITVALILSGCQLQSEDENKALGTIERDRITITATSTEIIVSLNKKEGDPVKKGDVLLELDKTKQKLIVKQAKAKKAKAQSKLQKLLNGERKEDLESAKALVDRAEANYQESKITHLRIEKLVEQKLSSISEKDKSIAAKRESEANLKTAKEKLSKLISGARTEDIDSAIAELEYQKATVKLEEEKLKDLTIVATRDAILDNYPYNLGERVKKDSIVTVLLASDNAYARVYVPQRSRLNFLKGQEKIIYIDGIEKPFHGVVGWVANEASFTPHYALTEKERSRLVYLAKVILKDDLSNIPSGIPAQVVLEVEE